MKLTKATLKRLIKEELNALMREEGEEVYPPPPAEVDIARLEDYSWQYDGDDYGDRYDETPSLIIRQGKDGKYYLKGYAGMATLVNIPAQGFGTAEEAVEVANKLGRPYDEMR